MHNDIILLLMHCTCYFAPRMVSFIIHVVFTCTYKKMFIRKHTKTVVGSSMEDTCVPMHLWSLAPRPTKKQAKDLDARYLLYGATSIFQWKLLPFTSGLGLNATMSMMSTSPDIYVYTSDISSSIFHWIVLFLFEVVVLLPKHKAFLLCTCVAERHAMILLFGSH